MWNETTLAMKMAATVSAGSRWPDGTTAAKGNVVIWSGEDDPADTLVPRLDPPALISAAFSSLARCLAEESGA
jgi:hypothetical protein